MPSHSRAHLYLVVPLCTYQDVVFLSWDCCLGLHVGEFLSTCSEVQWGRDLQWREALPLQVIVGVGGWREWWGPSSP